MLVSLRDKVAHRDRVHPSFTGAEELPTGELFDWPGVKGVTYDCFCQSMDNGIFEMFRELFPVLCGQRWIAGLPTGCVPLQHVGLSRVRSTRRAAS